MNRTLARIDVGGSAAGDESFSTQVARGTCPGEGESDYRAANSLARARVRMRLLWIAVIVLGIGHLIIPAWLVTMLSRPEKVALMDGTQSLIITSLVPVEEANQIRDSLAYWGAKALLDKNPAGFDAPETLKRIFSPQMAKKAEDEFSEAMREQYKQKQLYQTLKVARIDQQKIDANVVVVTVLGQLLTTAAIGEEPVTEPSWVKLNLKMVRNPYLGRNQRFPYMVVDFWNSTPEKLSVTKED
jgi:hypothetical protein